MNRGVLIRIGILSAALLPASCGASALAMKTHDDCKYETQHFCEPEMIDCVVPSCTSWTEIGLWVAALFFLVLWFWLGEKTLKKSTD